MNKRTLIHIVSEQTMQNVLPLLAFKPDRVIQILSEGDKYLAAARSTEAAVKEAGITAEFQDYSLKSPFPDINQVRYALKQNLSIFPGALVNVTGGTKPMFLGAFLGASEFHDTPILYCDSEQKKFVALGENKLPVDMADFAGTVSKLTLRIVMAAHGKPVDGWKFDTASEAQLAFGRIAFDLRYRNRDDFSAFSNGIRNFYKTEKGRVSSNPALLQTLCNMDLLEALRDPIPRSVTDFLEAATKAGFLVNHPDAKLTLQAPLPNQNLRSHVELIANIMDGSWFELTVLDLVLKSPRFFDAHWSVEPVAPASTSEDARSFGETDVVSLALPDGGLQVISCKTTLQKPLEHIEALRERSQNLGGRYARAVLAVLWATPAQTNELRRWGKLLSVKVLIGNELFNYFS